jgi:hypothetical protein
LARRKRRPGRIAGKVGISSGHLVREDDDRSMSDEVEVDHYTSEDKEIYNLEIQEDKMKEEIKRTKREVESLKDSDRERAIHINDHTLKPAQEKLTRLLIKKAKVEIRRDTHKLRKVKSKIEEAERRIHSVQDSRAEGQAQ